MSCGVGCRHGLDPALLGLWCRPAVVALIRPLAWEPPDAPSVALKRQKEKKKDSFAQVTRQKGFPAYILIRGQRPGMGE